MTLFGSDFKFQEPLAMLVVVLINFGVKNQVPKVSLKIVAGDLMSLFYHEFVDIIFCEYLYILEIISNFRIDSFTIIDIELLGNSYMIECTNTQSFEEGEKCASTISVENLDLFHTLETDMKLFGYDMILFGSIFKFQEPPVILLVVLINFVVKIKYQKSLSKLLLGI